MGKLENQKLNFYTTDGYHVEGVVNGTINDWLFDSTNGSEIKYHSDGISNGPDGMAGIQLKVITTEIEKMVKLLFKNIE